MELINYSEINTLINKYETIKTKMDKAFVLLKEAHNLNKGKGLPKEKYGDILLEELNKKEDMKYEDKYFKMNIYIMVIYI
jgi:hypothetical protein